MRPSLWDEPEQVAGGRAPPLAGPEAPPWEGAEAPTWEEAEGPPSEGADAPAPGGGPAGGAAMGDTPAELTRGLTRNFHVRTFQIEACLPLT